MPVLPPSASDFTRAVRANAEVEYYLIPRPRWSSILSAPINQRGIVAILVDGVVAERGGFLPTSLRPAQPEPPAPPTPVEPVFVIGSAISGNTLGYSTNGTTLLGLESSTFSTAVNYIIWDGTKWIAVGQSTDGTRIAYSTDGISWTKVTSSALASGRKIAYNGVLYVTVGDTSTSNLLTSTDGTSWTPRSLTVSRNVRGIASNGTYWLGGGSSGLSGRTPLLLSNNGTEWLNVAALVGIPLIPLTTSINGLAWNGTIWVAVGQGSSHSIMTSTDGINWTGRGNSMFSIGNDVVWNGTIFVAVGQGTNTIAYSSNGTSWTGVGTSIFSTRGNSVTWSSSGFFAVGNGTNAYASSPDGINWTGLGAADLLSATAIGAKSSVLFPASPSQQNWSWTSRTNLTDGLVNSAISSNGNIILGVSSSLTDVYVSTDGGATWTTNSALGSSLYGCCMSSDGTKQFVADRGGSTTLSYSTNSGSTWSSVTIEAGIFDIDCTSDGATLYILMGGGLFSSTNNGVTRTLVSNTIKDADRFSCSSNGTVMLAAFDSGNVYLSTNSGSTWAIQNSLGTASVWFVRVSGNGTTLTAVSSDTGALYISTNAGSSWSTNTSLTFYPSRIAVSSDGTKMLALATPDISVFSLCFYSENGGSTWLFTTGGQGMDIVSLTADGTKSFTQDTLPSTVARTGVYA